MIEFYEAASHVSIAANKNMSNRGWQACCRMIKRVSFFLMDCVFHDLTIMFQILIYIFCACLDRVLRMVRCCSSQSIRTQFSSAGKGLEMQFSFARLAFEWMQYLWQTSSYHWYVIFFWAEFKWPLMLIIIFLKLLAGALKMNSNLRELHLAENKLTPYDALQLAMLLTGNKSIQLIDLRFVLHANRITNHILQRFLIN